MDRIFLICAAGVAIVGAWLDVRDCKIPNWLTYSGILAALGIRAGLVGWQGFRAGGLGLLIAGVVFFILFLVGGMGGGDVKLMGAVAAWAGSDQISIILIAAGFAGGAQGLLYMVSRGQVRRTFCNAVELIRHHAVNGLRAHPFLNVRESGTLRVPYGVAIAMGALYCAAKVCWWR